MYCLGSATELLSALVVTAVCQDSKLGCTMQIYTYMSFQATCTQSKARNKNRCFKVKERFPNLKNKFIPNGTGANGI